MENKKHALNILNKWLLTRNYINEKVPTIFKAGDRIEITCGENSNKLVKKAVITYASKHGYVVQGQYYREFITYVDIAVGRIKISKIKPKLARTKTVAM